MEPIALVHDYMPERVFHQVYIDPFSGKSLIMQTALIDGEVAEVIGTMSTLGATETMKQWFWQQFQRECQERGVKRIIGKMPRHLYQHYHTAYGMDEIATENDPITGVLVVAERQLGG